MIISLQPAGREKQSESTESANQGAQTRPLEPERNYFVFIEDIILETSTIKGKIGQWFRNSSESLCQ